jgi:cell division septation protein DedD/nucleoid DNA-binding protein
MAYLGTYIRQLLSRKETVTLPGFGSLIARQGKGVSSEAEGIEPPGIVIAFDTEHPRDDGKLAAAYAEGEQIDPEEARQQVLELVDAIKFTLDKGEPFKLDQVGEFTRDQEFRIRFKKDPNWVIDPDLFGLSTLDLLELEDPAEEAPEDALSDKELSGTEPEVSSEKTEPVKNQHPVTRKPVNKWKIIWIVVGSLIAVLILLLLIPGNQEMKFGREGIILEDTHVGTVPEDPLVTPGSKEPAEAAARARTETGERQPIKESARETVEETARSTELPTPAENHYFIIAGSFQALQNASQLMDALKEKGYPAQIIITENRMYRVAVKSYVTKQEAVNDLPSVRAGTGLSGCWIMTR